MTWRIEHGDCIEVMRGMPDASVDAVVTDPPYFRVKSLPWDRQWDSSAAFLEWVGQLADEWRRILRPNGSLYVFASPKMAARVECEIGQRFAVLNHIVWAKHDGNGGGIHRRACKEDLRAWFPQSERIIFAEHFGADSTALGASGYAAKCDELRGFIFEPLRAYLDGERLRAGVSRQQIESATQSQMFGHWFSRVQWALPTRKHYETMRRLFNEAGGGDFLRREYDDLRREYDDLRREYDDLRREYDDLRRPFSVSAEVQFTDVWSFPTVQARPGKHPCEKPLELMRHIIEASTKPGGVVLDCFAGSAATGVAALQLGRQFIGIEKCSEWARRGKSRLVRVHPIDQVVRAEAHSTAGLPLFAGIEP